MDVKKIIVGKSFKNYKDLCYELGLKPTKKADDTRKAQFKQLDRYCAWHKEGHKIIIDEVFGEVKEKVDKRKNTKGNNTKYGNHIENCILFALHNEKSGKLILSTNRALRLCNLINDNYIEGRRNVEATSEALEIEKQFIYSFYNREQDSMKRSLENALRKLDYNRLLFHRKAIMVYVKEAHIEVNRTLKPRVGSDNDINYMVDTTHRLATDAEIRLIYRIEKEVYTELGCLDRKEVFESGQWNTYIKEVENRTKSQLNIQFYYEAYEILFTEEHIKKEVERMSYELSRREANAEKVKNTIACAKRRQTNAIKELQTSNIEEIGSGRLKELERRSNSNYINLYQKLVDTLIVKQPKINLKDEIIKIRNCKKVKVKDIDNNVIEGNQLGWVVEGEDVPF